MTKPTYSVGYQTALWLVALVPFVGLIAWFWTAGPGLTWDDSGMYLMHARALLEGRPYTDIELIVPSAVSFPRAQPPGYPVLLAIVMWVTGGYHAWAVRLATILIALPFVLLPGMILAKKHGFGVGMGTVALLGAGNAWLSMQIHSDLGFASLIWLLIYLLDGIERFEWRHVVLVMLIGTAAMSFRYLGVTVVPALWLYAFANRTRVGWKVFIPPVAWSTAGVAVLSVTGAWDAVFRHIGIGNPSFLPYVVSRFYNTFALTTAEALLGRDVTGHFVMADTEAMAAQLASDAGIPVLGYVMLVVAFVGVLVWARSEWRSPAFLFASIYLATLLSSWMQIPRYLIPILPIPVIGLFLGISWGLPHLLPRWSAHAVSKLMLVIGAGVIVSTSIGLTQLPRPVDLAELPETVEVYDYLRDAATSAEVRPMATNPRTMGWRLGVRTMPLFEGRGATAASEEIMDKRISHVVLSRAGPGTILSDRLRPMVTADPCRFEPVLENRIYEVYRVRNDCP